MNKMRTNNNLNNVLIEVCGILEMLANDKGQAICTEKRLRELAGFLRVIRKESAK